VQTSVARRQQPEGTPRRRAPPPVNRQLIQIEVPLRLRDRLLAGLLQGLLEALRQRIALGLLVLPRVFEQRLTPGFFGAQDVVRPLEFRFVLALRLDVSDDPPQIRVDDEGTAAAGAGNLELGLQFGHGTNDCASTGSRSDAIVTPRHVECVSGLSYGDAVSCREAWPACPGSPGRAVGRDAAVGAGAPGAGAPKSGANDRCRHASATADRDHPGPDHVVSRWCPAGPGAGHPEPSGSGALV